MIQFPSPTHLSDEEIYLAALTIVRLASAASGIPEVRAVDLAGMAPHTAWLVESLHVMYAVLCAENTRRVDLEAEHGIERLAAFLASAEGTA